jgi:hypothetical protein
MRVNRSSLRVIGADQAAEQKRIVIESWVVRRGLVDGKGGGADGVENR